MPRYRFEHKYLISPQTVAILRGRAVGIMQPDAYADENGGYIVNNLYLDDRHNRYYHAKHMGQYSRDKFRLRYYNKDLSFIRLERKHKDGILSYKDTLPVTQAQYETIRNGDLSFALTENAPLWQTVGILHRLHGLRPAAAFSYRRNTLVYKPGNTRLTFDSPLFPTPGCPQPRPHYSPLTYHYGRRPYQVLLEVKYTGFLPEIIKRLLSGLPLVQTEMSKYAIAREDGLL